jgi:transcriptional regulator with XRE-family HTH domain
VSQKKQANSVDTHVGSRVRLRRNQMRMSQERLAELLGLTFQQVQKYEKGANRIAAGRLYDIARVFGVPITYFYEGFEGHTVTSLAERDDFAAMMEFAASADGLKLVLAFARITEPKVRRRILDLVNSLADEPSEKCA